jgi:hypothetical protein
MKRLLALAVVGLGSAVIASGVPAADPPPPSWPGAKAQVFMWGDTVTAPSSFGTIPAVAGKQENFFTRTAGVKFRMYAVDLKTKKVLTPIDVRYAYVAIPGQPNLKLTYGKQGTAATAPHLWTAVWSIPADYPLGVVSFRILVRTKTNRGGSFRQVPVAAAQLTVLPAP